MKYFLLLTTYLSIASAISQTYQFQYICEYDNSEGINDLKEMNNSKKSVLKILLPQKTIILYDIKCNENFMEIKATLKGSGIPGLNFNGDNSTVIINKKRQIAFYLEDNEFKTVKLYEIEANKNPKTNKTYIKSLDSTTYLKMNSKLSFYVTPFPFLKTSKSGVSELKTKSMFFKLVSVKIINRPLMYDTLFPKNIDTSNLKICAFLN